MRIELNEFFRRDCTQISYEEFRDVMSRSIDLIISGLRNQDYDFLEKTCEETRLFCVKWVDYENQSKNSDFHFGRYIGAVEIISELIHERAKKNKVIKFIEDSSVLDIPHFNEVICAIAENPGIRHQQLAEKIGISKSTMSPIADKLVSCGLVSFSRPGKFKYYYLTPTGNEYYQNRLINIKSSKNLDVIMEELLLYINQDDNPSARIGEIIAKLYENKSKSEVFKKEEKLDFEGLTMLSEKKTNNVELKNRVVLFGKSEPSSVYLQEEFSNILMAIYRRKNSPKNTVPLQLGKELT